MGRTPWRPADMADAILGRSTRQPLPSELLAAQYPTGEPLAVDVPRRAVNLYVVRPNLDVWQLFLWFLDGGEPEVH